MRSKPIERPCFKKQSGRHLTNGTLSWLLTSMLHKCTFVYVQTWCAYIFLYIHVHVHTHTHTLTQEKPKLRILFGEDHLPIMYKAWVPSQHYPKRSLLLCLRNTSSTFQFELSFSRKALSSYQKVYMFSLLNVILHKTNWNFFQIGIIHACNINI